MKEFTCRVRLPNGNFSDMMFRAFNLNDVMSIVESMYGKDAFLGLLNERWA